MKLKILGSSSAGNCYIIENYSEALIIEAGIRFSEVKKGLSFDIRKVAGCLVSHRHGDHAGHLKELYDSGIPIYASKDVLSSKGIPYANPIVSEQGYSVGNFYIIPFDLKHDVPCQGFLINHPDCGVFVFITDTCYCEYKFPAINHFLIECNYSNDIIDSRVESGKINAAMRNRVIQSHIELEVCKGILKSNDLSNVQNIVLLHLSDGNSNEERFISEVTSLTGKQTFAANKGMTIEFNKTPF